MKEHGDPHSLSRHVGKYEASTKLATPNPFRECLYMKSSCARAELDPSEKVCICGHDSSLRMSLFEPQPSTQLV